MIENIEGFEIKFNENSKRIINIDISKFKNLETIRVGDFIKLYPPKNSAIGNIQRLGYKF